MVLKLKLAKFYGSSLPRPRIFMDVKFNEDWVDSPVLVLDPLLTWANEVYWSMGSLSFKRLRQSRIEGHISKLPTKRQKTEDKKQKSKKASSDSPPPTPIVTKRRRFLD